MLIIWLRATEGMGLDQGMMEQKYKIRGVFMGFCDHVPWPLMLHVPTVRVWGVVCDGEREGEMDWFVSSNSFQPV